MQLEWRGIDHLLKRRKKYQNGSYTKRQRKTRPPVWKFFYNDHSQQNTKQHVIFSTIEYPTKRDVQKAVQPILLRVNGSQAYRTQQQPTFGDLVERFIQEERLREIKAQPAGQTETEGLRYSTAGAYLSNLQRHILPHWGSMTIASIKAGDVLEWLQGTRTVPRTIGVASKPLSQESKGHLKAIMHRLYEKGMLWGLIDLQRNPVELVEIRGISKRRKKPAILIVKQYQAVSETLPDPYKTMFTVAICLGLRVNEILALKWSDFNFDAGVVRVQRGVVHGRISGVKTELFGRRPSDTPGFCLHPPKLVHTLSQNAGRLGIPEPQYGQTLPCKDNPARLSSPRWEAYRVELVSGMVYGTSHLPKPARRRWRTHRPTEAHAARLSEHHYGYLRECLSGVEEGSQWERRKSHLGYKSKQPEPRHRVSSGLSSVSIGSETPKWLRG